MEVKTFVYGGWFELSANTYVLIDSKKNCVVIDPGKDYSGIVDFIKEKGLAPQAILLTHGHFDHIGGIQVLKDAFDLPVYIHQADESLLKKPKLNGSDKFSRVNISFNINVNYLKENEELNILEEPISIIETPFHTNGSVCFYLKDSHMLFSGDTLFLESVGRTDFIVSNPKLMNNSLRKLMKLPDDVVVYPGHGETTTIKHEREVNNFCQMAIV